MKNRRRHKRFSATAFLNRPVHLNPLPPYFGYEINGKLIDLSAGGIAICIEELIPLRTDLILSVKFPDGFTIECTVQVKHIISRGKKYLHGFEFLNLSAHSVERIEKMSDDYINCESRIASKVLDPCRTDCALFSMCNKPEKINPVFDPAQILELTFKPLPQPTHL